MGALHLFYKLLSLFSLSFRYTSTLFSIQDDTDWVLMDVWESVVLRVDKVIWMVVVQLYLWNHVNDPLHNLTVAQKW